MRNLSDNKMMKNHSHNLRILLSQEEIASVHKQLEDDAQEKNFELKKHQPKGLVTQYDISKSDEGYCKIFINTQNQEVDVIIQNFEHKGGHNKVQKKVQLGSDQETNQQNLKFMIEACQLIHENPKEKYHVHFKQNILHSLEKEMNTFKIKVSDDKNYIINSVDTFKLAKLNDTPGWKTRVEGDIELSYYEMNFSIFRNGGIEDEQLFEFDLVSNTEHLFKKFNQDVATLKQNDQINSYMDIFLVLQQIFNSQRGFLDEAKWGQVTQDAKMSFTVRENTGLFQLIIANPEEDDEEQIPHYSLILKPSNYEKLNQIFTINLDIATTFKRDKKEILAEDFLKKFKTSLMPLLNYTAIQILNYFNEKDSQDTIKSQKDGQNHINEIRTVSQYDGGNMIMSSWYHYTVQGVLEQYVYLQSNYFEIFLNNQLAYKMTLKEKSGQLQLTITSQLNGGYDKYNDYLEVETEYVMKNAHINNVLQMMKSLVENYRYVTGDSGKKRVI